MNDSGINRYVVGDRVGNRLSRTYFWKVHRFHDCVRIPLRNLSGELLEALDKTTETSPHYLVISPANENAMFVNPLVSIN